MNQRSVRVVSVVTVLLIGVNLALAARAGEHPAPHGAASGATTTGASAAHAPLPYNHPTLPSPALWPGVTLIVILGAFLLAAGVGVTVRLNAPEELPSTTHSHDEPPGASGHHGPAGTADPGHGHH